MLDLLFTPYFVCLFLLCQLSLNHLPLLSSETSFPFFPMLRAFCCRLSCLLHLPVGSVLFLLLDSQMSQGSSCSCLSSPWREKLSLGVRTRLVTRRGRVGLDLMKCAYTACQKSTFLAGNKSCSGSHKFFVLATGDICVLFITKIWLMLSCSCCRALLKAGWPFSTDIPCTHRVCFLSLGSFVPVMFCFSGKLEKAKWFLFSYSKARQNCGVSFCLACIHLYSKIGLLSLAGGSIFQPNFLKHDYDV